MDATWSLNCCSYADVYSPISQYRNLCHLQWMFTEVQHLCLWFLISTFMDWHVWNIMVFQWALCCGLPCCCGWLLWCIGVNVKSEMRPCPMWRTVNLSFNYDQNGVGCAKCLNSPCQVDSWRFVMLAFHIRYIIFSHVNLKESSVANCFGS